MEAQFEALSELVKNGQKLNFGQDFFVKFYQAFLYSDRWQQYIKGVGTTLLVTAIALVLGVVLGAIVAMVRVGYAQQKPHHRNPILGIFNAVAQVYVTVIRGTPMMVQLLIMSMVIFASSPTSRWSERWRWASTRAPMCRRSSAAVSWPLTRARWRQDAASDSTT